MITCEQCDSDDIQGLGTLEDGRLQVRCSNCGHEWTRGEARRVAPRTDYEAARSTFPGADQVDPARMKLVDELKSEFLARHPEPDPEAEAFWRHYQHIFSPEGLRTCDPQELKNFANRETGARPGNMSVFNRAWNDMGTAEGFARTRGALEYLLYGPDRVPIEDRLTDLIEERQGRGMTGFKESLLTKVLCIMRPDEFIPILTYSSEADGKKEIAWKIYQLRLPEAARVQWTIGRLIFWSNEVLRNLAGDGFAHMQHVAQFFWETKDHPALCAAA